MTEIIDMFKRKRTGYCPFCEVDTWAMPESAFRDDLSRREFLISGLCQACQDKTFEDETH